MTNTEAEKVSVAAVARRPPTRGASPTSQVTYQGQNHGVARMR